MSPKCTYEQDACRAPADAIWASAAVRSPSQDPGPDSMLDARRHGLIHCAAKGASIRVGSSLIPLMQSPPSRLPRRRRISANPMPWKEPPMPSDSFYDGTTTLSRHHHVMRQLFRPSWQLPGKSPPRPSFAREIGELFYCELQTGGAKSCELTAASQSNFSQRTSIHAGSRPANNRDGGLPAGWA